MRFCLTYLLNVLFLVSYAQGFRVRHLVPGSALNLSKGIFETTPGNYIAGGIIVDSTSGGNRLCILGLGNQGQVLWTKKYGRNNFMYLDNPFITRSFYKQGNHIYHTTSVLDSNGRYIGVLIKFNFNGDTVWQKKYLDQDPLEDVVPQLVTGSVDGGFLITGYFQNNSNTPYSKCMLIKTDVNGKELWRKKIAKVTPNTQDGRIIIQDSTTKKIVIAGYQYIGDAESWSLYDNVMILDSLGNLIIRKNYMPGPGCVILDMIQTRDKKMAIVGYITSPKTPGFDYLMRAFAVKFDLNAPTFSIWQMAVDIPSPTNNFSCLTELNNGDLMIAGGYDTQQLNFLPQNNLIRLVKVSSNGIIKSKRYYNYKTNDSASANAMGIASINLNSDGSLVSAISIASISYPPFVPPLFFVKWDSTGCDSSLAYCQMMNTVGVHENKMYNNESVSAYPNPCKREITFSAFSSSADRTIILKDITGREIKNLNLGPGVEKIEIMLDDINNGVYLLELKRDKDLLYSTKLIKLD